MKRYTKCNTTSNLSDMSEESLRSHMKKINYSPKAAHGQCFFKSRKVKESIVGSKTGETETNSSPADGISTASRSGKCQRISMLVFCGNPVLFCAKGCKFLLCLGLILHWAVAPGLEKRTVLRSYSEVKCLQGFSNACG